MTIANLLASYRFSFSTEQELQDLVEGVLRAARVRYEREFRLDQHSRPDFFLPETGTAIEIKIKGRAAEVTLQLQRYAAFDQVKEIVLLTSRMTHGTCPSVACGKPVRKVKLWNL